MEPLVDSTFKASQPQDEIGTSENLGKTNKDERCAKTTSDAPKTFFS
jgi:hypothetical protein